MTVPVGALSLINRGIQNRRRHLQMDLALCQSYAEAQDLRRRIAALCESFEELDKLAVAACERLSPGPHDPAWIQALDHRLEAL